MAQDNARPKATPQDVFLYLGVVLSLYASAMAFIILAHQFIEKYVADPLSPSHAYSAGYEVRWPISVLVIAFPALLALSAIIGKRIRAAEEKLLIAPRKWLISLNLFIGGITILVQFMRIVYNYLEGDLGKTIFLEILVLLFVSGTAFAYYLLDLRRSNARFGTFGPTPMGLIAFTVSIVVAVSVIGGLVLHGSPYAERNRRADRERTSDIRSFQGEIIRFWQIESRLPERLDEIPNVSSVKDPERGVPYEYHKKGDLTFELCADFATDTSASDDEARYYGSQEWMHKKGKACFSHTIRPPKDASSK